MNRPTPISAFSDQRRTKSTTRSRTSCGTQIPVRVPQDFFLARCAPPSAQPGPHPWSVPSSPRTRSVSASPPLVAGDALETEKRRLRSRTVPSASGRTPLGAILTDERFLHFQLRQDNACMARMGYTCNSYSIERDVSRMLLFDDSRV